MPSLNEAAALRIAANADAFDDVVNGDASTTVTLPGGATVSSVRKLIADKGADLDAETANAAAWASKYTGEPVDGSNYSAREWAMGFAGSPPGGSAFSWATSLDVVADGLRGARYYAEQALGALEGINGTYLGAATADPSTDLNGNAVTAGDWYTNTATGRVRVYSGSAWSDAVSGLTAGANETITGTWGYEAPVHLVVNVAGVTKASTDYENGERGPLLIWNNQDFTDDSHIAGQVLGLKIAVASSLTATPAKDDAVPLQVIASNESGRGQLWACNFVALQDASGSDGLVHTIEAEVNAVKSEQTDPFDPTGNPRKVAIEAVAQTNGVYRTTSAFWGWSAPATNAAWHSRGLSLSRIADVGVDFGVWHTDDPDVSTTASFRTAAILDRSKSAAVLKVESDHASIIDLSDLGNITDFIKGKSGADTSLRIRNDADFGVNLVLDSGSTTTKQKSIVFNDQGSAAWSVIANAGDGTGFSIFNHTSGASAIFVGADDEVALAGGLAVATGHSFRLGSDQVVDASRGLRFRTYAATAIADVADAVNTTDKAAGKAVWDTTNNRMMVASGSAAADPWYVADGSASVTPA